MKKAQKDVYMFKLKKKKKQQYHRLTFVFRLTQSFFITPDKNVSLKIAIEFSYEDREILKRDFYQ